MTADDICGAACVDGSPCQHPAGSCPVPSHSDPDAENPHGRDSKLTKQRQEDIAAAIEDGKSIRSAARMAGISPQTFHSWMSRGETQDEGIYRDFLDRIARAKGHGEDKYFNTVWEMAKEDGDHRFLASLMKQRYPESWGETETGVDSDAPVINLPESVTEQWERTPPE